MNKPTSVIELRTKNIDPACELSFNFKKVPIAEKTTNNNNRILNKLFILQKFIDFTM